MPPPRAFMTRESRVTDTNTCLKRDLSAATRYKNLTRTAMFLSQDEPYTNFILLATEATDTSPLDYDSMQTTWKLPLPWTAGRVPYHGSQLRRHRETARPKV